MANLNTHLQSSAVVSGVAASAFYSVGILDSGSALICWALGLLGGILPDVDSDDPKGASIIFGLFALITSSITMIAVIDDRPLLLAWGFSALVFAVVYFGLRTVFLKYTEHRGAFHSILGGCMFVLFTVIGADLLGADAVTSWFFAMFIGFGYLLHLFLDEAFRVNLMGGECKKPFGGAIKLLDLNNYKASIIMVVLASVAFYFAPDTKEFVNIAFNSDTYSNVVTSFYGK